MRKYHKYIIKDMGKLLPKLFAIVLIVVLGVGISVGLLTSAPNMRYSVEKYYDEVNAADIIVQANSPFSKEILDEFSKHEVFEDVSGFYSFDEDVVFRNGKHLAKINVIDFREVITVNQLTLIEGRFPDPNSEVIEIVIERKQPFFIDVPLNYETSFMDKQVKVVGIVHNPWYFAFVEEISYTKQRPIEVIIYANQGLLEEVSYTNIAVTLNDAKDIDMFSNKYEDFIDEKVKILNQDYPDYHYLTRNQNQSFAKYKSDVKIVEAIALVFPLFFLLITILVSMASITRIIEDQRKEIGTLRSLGYGKFRIMGKYILYALISAGLGAIIGIGLGIYFIPAVIYDAYSTIYNLPVFSIKYYFSYTSAVSIAMILSVVLVTIGSIDSALREKPTELFKVKTQKPGKKIFLERIGFIWKRLKFKYKSTFRNIFRHKRNLILMIIGISGSTALLLAGFGIKDSVELAGRYQFEEMMNYDLEITVNSDYEVIEEINQYDNIYVLSVTGQYLSKDYITIIVPKDSNNINEYINFMGPNEIRFSMESNSVIVTKQFSEKHKIKVGDNIALNILDKDVLLKVTNIQEYFFGNNIYISKELLEDKIDYKSNKIYVKTGIIDNNRRNLLDNKLNEHENVVKTMFEEDLKYSYKNTSESMNSIIIVLILAASALAIIINYNLTLINVHSRKREIATLKVLGYQESEISGYVFRETFIISLFSILVGLLVGRLLHLFIVGQVVVDGVLLSNKIWWPSYIYTFVLSILFLGIVYFITLPQTRRIDMIDALKSYE